MIVSTTGTRYTAAEISRLERQSFSSLTTTLLGGGIFAGVCPTCGSRSRWGA